MRSRKEIEDAYSKQDLNIGEEDLSLLLEVLLDIREKLDIIIHDGIGGI